MRLIPNDDLGRATTRSGSPSLSRAADLLLRVLGRTRARTAQADVSALLQTKHLAVSLISDCDQEEMAKLAVRIYATRDFLEFWFLRPEIYAIVARRHGERVARYRLATVEGAMSSHIGNPAGAGR